MLNVSVFFFYRESRDWSPDGVKKLACNCDLSGWLRRLRITPVHLMSGHPLTTLKENQAVGSQESRRRLEYLRIGNEGKEKL